MFPDGEGALGNDKKTIRNILAVFEVKDLGQGNLLAVSRVGKTGQQDGVVVLITQGHGPGALAELITFTLVFAPDIGGQGPLPAFRPGSLVVDQFLLGHQQGEDGVDNGGFS